MSSFVGTVAGFCLLDGVGFDGGGVGVAGFASGEGGASVGAGEEADVGAGDGLHAQTARPLLPLTVRTPFG